MSSLCTHARSQSLSSQWPSAADCNEALLQLVDVNDSWMVWRRAPCAGALFDTLELEIAMNYSVHSQSVNASFTWDLTNRLVRCDWAQGLRHFKCSHWHAVTLTTGCRSVVPVLRIFFVTDCRYFHIMSTCYETVWQILRLKELMCKWHIVTYCLTLLIHKTICCLQLNLSFFVFCDFPR